MSNLIPVEFIEKRIFYLRNAKVMIDRHLAEMYGVDTRILNQAVKRNSKRFPHSFPGNKTTSYRGEKAKT